MRKSYKIILIVISILLIGSIIIGTSYSMWVKTAVQKEKNIVNSSCFDIEFTESSSINLASAIPISDEAGLKKKPYTFTLKNTCNMNSKVTIALDVLSTSTMSSSAIKTSLTKGNKSGTPTLLTSLDKKAEVDISDAKEAYILGTDIIGANKSKSYSLYLWMDEAVTVAEASKSFSSKVVVVNTATEEEPPIEILGKVITDTTQIATDDPDNNIRYIGANPNNYVYFNCSDYSNQSDSTCEKWRIIGVFKNMTKEDGSKEDLVKIIRDDRLGKAVWDSNHVNDWSTASLQKTLNGEYYNGTYATGALKNDTTRNAIESVVWNLGGSSTYDDVTASMFYERERGTTVYSGRPTTWTGKIALMYPSDYGYATSGNSTTDRATCLSNELYKWVSASDCYNNDYLFNDSYNQWTLAPCSPASSFAFIVDSVGYVRNTDFYDAYGVRPAAYLKSSISLSSVGDGSSTSPYQLKVG